MEVVQTKLVNDVISIHNSGIDWVAWIALGVSILATIGTLWWQNHIRRKDEKANAKMRKWSAEYPHKLAIYSEFYKTLNDIMLMELEILTPENVIKIANSLQKNLNEAQLFFSEEICEEIDSLYKELDMFLKQPLDGAEVTFLEFCSADRLDYKDLGKDIMNSFYFVQEHAEECLHNERLKQLFLKQLKYPAEDNNVQN